MNDKSIPWVPLLARGGVVAGDVPEILPRGQYLYPAHPLLNQVHSEVTSTTTITRTSFSLADLELPEDLKKFRDESADITRDIMRKVSEAFAAGAPFVSLTSNGHEISRIYADGRSTLCNLDVPRSWEWPHTS